MAQDAPDVGKEAHVEHPIGLVQHQVLEAPKLRVRRAEMIQQPAWRTDDHVDTAPKRMLLRTHSHAAEHRRRR